MRRLSAVILTLALCAVLLPVVSCGGNMSMTGRQLQSITVTPPSADARNFSSGMVQFTAMGNFTMSPMSAAPAVMWSIGNPFSSQPAPAGVTISATGLAQCSGFTGSAIVMATAPMDPMIPLAQMSTLTSNVSGSSTLICP
ncbi:MAG TPA: hypothetical protein VFP71_06520 [Candidatus Angelobacter sp.]|nr:hypothetical protein [Candidatus Angelobacter sp.]